MGKEDLDPGMGVPLPDREVTSKVVPFRRQESRHKSGGNAETPQHEDHRRCVMFTVPGLSGEEKILDGAGGWSGFQIEAVSIAGQQVPVDGQGLFVRRFCALSHAACQVHHLRGQLGDLKIPITEGVGIVQFGGELFVCQDLAFT